MQEFRKELCREKAEGTHSTVPLKRELASELRLCENTGPDTGKGRAKAGRVGDPGTGQGTYGWAGTKASHRRSLDFCPKMKN